MQNLKMPRGRLAEPGAIRSLFLLCWVSYISAYLGRLNYSACLVEIMNTEGWTKGQAGLIATGFFTTYGLGQLLNGFIGDKLSPKLMVGCGLLFSAAANLLFPFTHSVSMILLLWCINGFVQSMIWSPLIRLLSEWMPAEKRLMACVNMNSTVPAGTLAVYGLSAVVVYLGNWRAVFFLSGGLMILMSVLWFAGITRLETHLLPAPPAPRPRKEAAAEAAPSLWTLALLSAMPLCLAGLAMQGMLKDGVTTWIPTFLEENFGMTAATSILCTTIVPIINLGGVYLGSWLNRRYFKNEVYTAALFFLAALAALLLLVFCPANSAVLSLVLLTATTTFMMAINTLLASMMPSYYVQFGVCSTVTGVLNAAAYLGCALSSYGNGAIAERFGWNSIMLCWCFCALVGAAVCALGARKWKRFRKLTPANDL